MIKEVTMFTVLCDNCGVDSNRDCEYSCWGDKSQAEEHAMNSDWHLDDKKHYCCNCFSYDENDNLILREVHNKTTKK